MIRIDRLRNLITALAEHRDAKKPFDMDDWYKPEEGRVPSCDTAACALGTAALHPLFAADGWKITSIRDRWTPRWKEEGGPTHSADLYFGFNDLVERDEQRLLELMRDGGEPDTLADYLFMPGHYTEHQSQEITEDVVIHRVQKLINSIIAGGIPHAGACASA